MRIALIASGVLTFLAASVLGASTLDRWKNFWASHPYILFASTLVTLGLPALQTIALDSGERKRRKRVERDRSFAELLTGALVSIVEEVGSDYTKTGVHLFLVQSRRTWKRPLKPVAYHEHVARVKLSFAPPTSGIDWVEGKGVIGRCWSRREIVLADLRNDFGPHMNASEQDWGKLTAEQRFGLSFQEFGHTKKWYGLVGAAPILDRKGREYLGCVSFDTPLNGPVNVDIGEVEETLRVYAVAIQTVLEGSG